MTSEFNSPNPWGSLFRPRASSKRNLAFSYIIMLYPDEAIDYVVVHELAHILEMNHSERFYKIIEAVLPDYRERQKMLKK